MSTWRVICLLVLTLLIIGFSTGNIIAEEQSQNGSEPAEKSGAEKTIHLRAGKLNYRNDKIIVKENVKVIKGDTVLEAQAGEIYREENRALLKNKVMVNYNKGTVSSEQLTAWLDEDRYVFTDDVKLKHAIENDKQLALESSSLEMFTGDNSFNASDGVIINYNHRKMKAQIAHYNGKKQILVLEKGVYIEENGEWIKSNNAQFFLSTGDEKFDAEGDVELEFNLD